MSALLAVGVALVAFGAVVLLLFPHRPGGRIAWHGLEVSSVGAGLPLIVVGVVAVAIGGDARLGGESGSPTSAAAAAGGAVGSGCLKKYFAGIPAARLDTLEEGVHDRDVIGTADPKPGPVGLTFTEFARPIGALRLVFLGENSLFKIESVVDSACRSVDDYENESRPGTDKHTLQNYDALRLRLGDRWYTLAVGAGSTLRFSFFHVEP